MGRNDSPRLSIKSLTFFEYVLEVRHALNICSGNIFVLSDDRLDLTAKFLQRNRVAYKKTAKKLVSAKTLKVEYDDSQNIGHCRSCCISTCNKHVDNLVADKMYVVMILAIEIGDERVPIRFLCVVAVLLQGIFDKLFCI